MEIFIDYERRHEYVQCDDTVVYCNGYYFFSIHVVSWQFADLVLFNQHGDDLDFNSIQNRKQSGRYYMGKWN